MRSPLVLVLMFALSLDATGACICCIGPIHIYANQAAICLAKRYEDGDCSLTTCTSPTNVWVYRMKDDYNPEFCPLCHLYRDAKYVAKDEDESAGCSNCGSDATDTDAAREARPVEPPTGLPVDRDFDPITTEPKLPERSRAQVIGTFKLSTKDKVATNIDSTSCVAVGEDIYVKIFRVITPQTPGEPQMIAYELKAPDPEATTVAPSQITNVRYDPSFPDIPDRILGLQISHRDHPVLKNKQVIVLRKAKIVSRKAAD
jgi:hypothetical protein